MMLFYAGINSAADVARKEMCRKVCPEEGASLVEVRKEIRFSVGDIETRLSLAFAWKQGYRMLLIGDGDGEVVKIDGTVYSIHQFSCDCPDQVGRGGSYGGQCKHSIWLSQMRPCSMCGGVMYLGEFRTAFGETVRRFECGICGNARDAALVREERRQLLKGGSQDIALMPEGRCRQALAWVRARGITRFIWQVLDQSPELAPVMARVLADAGEDDLVAAVGRKYGVEAKAA